MSELATRDQLFAGCARRYKEVTLPVRGVTVRIQSLSERERTAFRAAMMKKDGELNRERVLDSNRRLIVLCVVDEVGNRILNDSDIARLAEWDAADTEFLSAECGKHTGIIGSEPEDIEKNSEKTDAAG